MIMALLAAKFCLHRSRLRTLFREVFGNSISFMEQQMKLLLLFLPHLHKILLFKTL